MATSPTNLPPLHQLRPLPHAVINRLFAAVYASAVLALLYRHTTSLLFHHKTSLSVTLLHLTFLISDLVLAFMWLTAQALRIFPVRREQFPANLEKVVPGGEEEFPALDVFICTADPYKEPPLRVVNTALSVMAYEYPTEKLSVYVSDDGGSALTLFAFMEAAKFAAHWLPFCRENDVVDRSPDVYLASSYCSSPETNKIKMMYDEMKEKIEGAVEKGGVDGESLTTDAERRAFNKWNDNNSSFSTNNHPPVLQILLDNKRNKDRAGGFLPSLIYVSREKSTTTHHHFKAGALNVLLRVSAVLTNAPLILTLDCDMLSTNPRTPLHVLCYYFSVGDSFRSSHAFVQFPQRFRGINRDDIYAGDLKNFVTVLPFGFDGLMGPIHMGTCCFFNRRAFFGGPSDSDFVPPEIPQLFPGRMVDKPIHDQDLLGLAHRVAGCDYEAQTHWGTKMGFRYGTLVEDLYTGFRLQCEGWRSIWCYPESPFFLGDSPTSFADLLIQQSRWQIGLLEISLCQHSPLVFGIKKLGLLLGLGYCHYTLWIVWVLPVTTYAFLPQLALLNGVSIFPKASDPWFLVYAFLFLGAYGQDMLEFLTIDNRGTFRRWWNDQRMWIVRGLSCSLFGGFHFLLKSLGISQQKGGFSLTSKVTDEEQRKRYDRGMFEFGAAASPIFVPMTAAALITLLSFVVGVCNISGWRSGDMDGLLIQILLSGFGVLNSFPIYEAMVLRKDPGKLQGKTTMVAVFLSIVLCSIASISFSRF